MIHQQYNQMKQHIVYALKYDKKKGNFYLNYFFFCLVILWINDSL
jgi:hypothetical protein